VALRNNPPRVLIVEDSQELGNILKKALSVLDIEVIHELNGATALATFQSWHPDLILLDIELPDTTGWRLLDTLRGVTAPGDKFSVIVVTALSDAVNRVAGRIQDVQAYLIKPFSIDQVRKLVTSLLSERANQ
jgi:two-component system, OmpR family, response regulator